MLTFQFIIQSLLLLFILRRNRWVLEGCFELRNIQHQRRHDTIKVFHKCSLMSRKCRLCVHCRHGRRLWLCLLLHVIGSCWLRHSTRIGPIHRLNWTCHIHLLDCILSLLLLCEDCTDLLQLLFTNTTLASSIHNRHKFWIAG